MMNILMLASDNNKASGAFRSMVILTELLKKEGANVTVIVPNNGDGLELLKQYKIDYKLVKSENWIVNNKFSIIGYLKKILKTLIFNSKAIKEIRNIIKEKNIDIVHLNTSWCYVGALAAIKENTKFVWHIREFLEEDQNNKIIFRKNGYSLINKANKIICISKSIYNKYNKIFDKEKIEVIYNGIDINDFYKHDKCIFNNDNNKIKLVCVGRIFKKKGQRELVEALGKTLNQKNNYNLELDLIGSYSEGEKELIDNITAKYNIKNIVNFRGKCFNVNEIYEKSDIAFMCSEAEAFGRVTVEAMLSGCLVIGKDSAGTREILKNNETGLLYTDVDDLSKKIIFALENRSKMQEIANEGRKFAKENFSAKQNADNVFCVYEKLMK